MGPLRQLFAAVFALLLAAEVSAGVTYSFELKNLNSKYTSEFTVGAASGGNGSITNVTSTFVDLGSGTSSPFSGFSTGSFSWNDGTGTLSMHYSVAGASFSVTLRDVGFSGGVDSSGLPEGHLTGLPAGAGSAQPQLTISGGTGGSWTTSQFVYFKRDGLLGDPPAVPGPGGLVALGGLGLLGRRRRR